MLRAASVFGRHVLGRRACAALLGGGDDAARWLARARGARAGRARARESRFPGEREYALPPRAGARGGVRDADRRRTARSATGSPAEWLERAGERDAVVAGRALRRRGEPARAVALVRARGGAGPGAQRLRRGRRGAERGVACGARGACWASLRGAGGGALLARRFAGGGAARGGGEEPFAEGERAWFEATQLAITASVRLGRSQRSSGSRTSSRARPAPGPTRLPARAASGARRSTSSIGERERAARLDAMAGETADALAGAWRAVYRAQSANLAGDVSAGLREQQTRGRSSSARTTGGGRASRRRVGYAQARLGDDRPPRRTCAARSPTAAPWASGRWRPPCSTTSAPCSRGSGA